MTDELMALADRVEALTGPCRETDVEIWLATTPEATRVQWSYVHKATGRVCEVDETRDADRRLVIAPAFTTSLDAAMTLVPEGHYPDIGAKRTDDGWYANIWRYGFGHTGTAEAATPALALTAAALRARAAKEPEA